MTADPIKPDTKDWTWVLERACPECGFDAGRLGTDQLTQLFRDNAIAWGRLLSDDSAEHPVAARPEPGTWSPLEYACHVRDVHLVFDERVTLMLFEHEPHFADWDQDVTAVEDDYAGQDPAGVALGLVEAAGAVSGRYAAVEGDQWQRRGIRSNGSEFTVESIARYHAHDVVHHAFDVGLELDQTDDQTGDQTGDPLPETLR